MKKQTLVLLALGSALMLSGCQSEKEQPMETATAEFSTISAVVEDNGTVVHRDPYTIYATVNGKILTCNFEEGDRVKAGDILYTLDATALEDQITQAEINLRSAKQGLSQASEACRDLTVTAKAGGTVMRTYLHKGDFVSVGTPIADVVDQDNMTLTAPFAPADAANIAVGSAATVTFPSYNGDIAGTVKRIYDAPTALPGGRQCVNVEIAFQNTGVLLGGETAFAQVGAIASMEAGQVKNAVAQTLYATQSGQVLTLPIDLGSVVAVGDTVLTLENDALTNGRDNARIAVESAETGLSQLVAKRDDFVLRAPADGVILTRNAKAEDYAAAVNPLAILAQDASLGVDVPIDEIYIEKVFAGQTASVLFTDDMGQNHTYPATVSQVDEAGMVNGGVTDYMVSLTLENTEALKAGMNVTVSIVTAQKDNCLTIPAAALGPDSTVTVQRDGKEEAVVVETGVSGNGLVEVLSGLAEGDTVIYPAP